MSVRITCIQKDNGNHDNPHQAIEKLGWVNSSNKDGICSLSQMVEFIEKGGRAYVVDSYDSSKVYLYVRTSRNGNKFVQTRSNDTATDNLLELNPCY